MTQLLIGCSVLALTMIVVCIQIFRTQRVFTVIWDSERLDRRAPLFWRMFLASKLVTFKGRVI